MFKRLTISFFVLLLVVAPAWADWDQVDGHKMHFPQLPNPDGWDVEISSIDNQHECADDWQCSQTGPVDDIHFWYSVAGDGGTQIGSVHAAIYADDRPAQSYSRPGALLWERTFDSSEFTVVDPAGTGDQGFADPQQSVWTSNDHDTYQQLNIVDILNPFVQQEGTIYWLGLHVWWDGSQEPVGWKTSLDTFEDAAVYRDGTDGPWLPLDPTAGPLDTSIPGRLDFAFVITPEPATLALLVIGAALGLAGRRR